MAPIQILPAIPSFGSRLAQALGGAVSNVAEGYGQRLQKQAVKALTTQLQNPNATPMEKLSTATRLVQRLGPEAAKAIMPLYAPFIFGEQQGTPQGAPPAGQAPEVPRQQGVPEGATAPIQASTAPTELEKGPAPSGQTRSDQEARKKELLKQVGLPYGIGDRAKAELEQIRSDEKLSLKKSETEQRLIDKSYEAQRDFISKITGQNKAWQTEMKPKLLQMQSIPANELIGPTAAKFLEAMNIPLGALENPSSELYSKLSQDLLKGLPETYGNKILLAEVENFLKTIPQLVNSPDGRRMIASNMLKLGEMKEIYYNEMRREQKELLDKDQKFPKDFEERIFDSVKPQIDRLNSEFIQLSSIKSVPENHVPFFNPQGGISFIPNNPKALEWAQQNGGKRIW